MHPSFHQIMVKKEQAVTAFEHCLPTADRQAAQEKPYVFHALQMVLYYKLLWKYDLVSRNGAYPWNLKMMEMVQRHVRTDSQTG